MSKEDFVKRWKIHLAGLALYGLTSEALDTPMKRAARAMDVPGEVERLLGKMWDDLHEMASNCPWFCFRERFSTDAHAT